MTEVTSSASTNFHIRHQMWSLERFLHSDWLCGKPVVRELTVGGDCKTECKRRYMLYIPNVVCENMDGGSSDALPLVFSVHCLGCNMQTMEAWSEVAEMYNFVRVNPEGIQNSFNAGGESCCGDALENNVDDLGFFQEIVVTLQSEFQFVSSGATYGMGWSNGGYMVTAAARMLRAIAPISGYQIESLQVDRPTPLFLHHSEDDAFVRMTGCCTDTTMPRCCCQLSNFADQCTPAPDHVSEWAHRFNGCPKDAAPQTTISRPEQVMCYTYVGCQANTTYCIHQDKGHFNRPAFMTSFPMTNDIADFFARDACSMNQGHWSSTHRTCTCQTGGAYDGTYCLHELGAKSRGDSSGDLWMEDDNSMLGMELALVAIAVALAIGFSWTRRSKRYQGYNKASTVELSNRRK